MKRPRQGGVIMIYEERMKPTLEDYGKEGRITAKGVLRMLENIAAYHSDSLGYGAGTMDKTGISWILLEWNVRILRMPNYGEVLRVTTWSRGRASRFSSLRDFEIYGEDGKTCVIASSKWALIDFATKKPAVIDDELEDIYQTEQKQVFEDGAFMRLLEPREYSAQTTLSIGRRDIDLNGHVHNLCYLDFAYEALPEAVYRAEFCDIRIAYRKEIRPYETIACKYVEKDGAHTVGIYGENGALRALVAFSGQNVFGAAAL